MNHKESFLQYLLIEKRYSPHTIRSYQNDLDQFFSFLQTLGCSSNPEEITAHEVRAWIVSMMDDKIQPVTVHRKMACPPNPSGTDWVCAARGRVG